MDGQFLHFVLPSRSFERQRLANINVPAAPSEKKRLGGAGYAPHRSRKIIEQKNIAIYVAEQIVARKLLRLIVNTGQVFRAVTIFAHRRHVTNTQFRAYLRGACVIAKKQNLHVRVNLLPTAQRISLDHVDVTQKRLRRGKKRQHAAACSASLAA